LGVIFWSVARVNFEVQRPCVEDEPYGGIWVAALIGALLLSLLLMIYEPTRKTANVLVICVFSAWLINHVYHVANQLLDRSATMQHVMILETKTSTAGGRGLKRYDLRLRDGTDPNKSACFGVNRQFYENQKVGQPVVFLSRSGFFGYEWFVSE
jgi:hypothetical protein